MGWGGAETQETKTGALHADCGRPSQQDPLGVSANEITLDVNKKAWRATGQPSMALTTSAKTLPWRVQPRPGPTSGPLTTQPQSWKPACKLYSRNHWAQKQTALDDSLTSWVSCYQVSSEWTAALNWQPHAQSDLWAQPEKWCRNIGWLAFPTLPSTVSRAWSPPGYKSEEHQGAQTHCKKPPLPKTRLVHTVAKPRIITLWKTFSKKLL